MNCNRATNLIVVSLSLLLGGCCYFYPCHPGSSLIGVVQSAGGIPIEDATVSLFGTSRAIGKDGCFSFRLADAPPFTLSATAKGYVPFEGKAKYGTYHVTLILEPVGSRMPSKATWRKISSVEFERESKTRP